MERRRMRTADEWYFLLHSSPGVAQLRSLGVVEPRSGEQVRVSELVSLSSAVLKVLVGADTTHGGCGTEEDSLHLVD